MKPNVSFVGLEISALMTLIRRCQQNEPNHIRKLLMIVMTLWVGINVFAQPKQYNGRGLYDLKGNVESVKYTNQAPLGWKNVSFTPEGLISDSYLTFDEKGYAIGKDMNGLGKYEIINISYTKTDRPSEITIESNMPGFKSCSVHFEYDGHNLSCMTVTYPGKADKTIEYTYSNLQKDNLGNWISREVREKTIETSKSKIKEKEKTYTERREIKYY